MSLRALLYRRPAEPKAIQIYHEQNVYLVRVRRHRQARRYTLRIQAATREVVLTMPPRGSLREAMQSLKADHEFLMKGDVFTADLISTYIDYKRSSEVDPIRLRPHPYEFFLYYDL